MASESVGVVARIEVRPDAIDAFEEAIEMQRFRPLGEDRFHPALLESPGTAGSPAGRRRTVVQHCIPIYRSQLCRITAST